MATLVTGGTGFLGRSVVRELADLGDELVLLVREGREVGELPPGVRVQRGDVADLDDVGAAMVGCSTVVHMAAMVSIFHPRAELFRRINVGGLRNVIQAASFGAVDRILYTSSILTLGPTADAIGVEGREPAIPVPGNHYMASKAEALAMAREHASQGAPITTVFPGIVYGPGPKREAGIMTQMLADLMAGRLPATIGPGDRPWCHAYTDDVARGHKLALTAGQPGREYILGGPNATIAEWLATAVRVTGARPPRWQLPYAVASMVGAVDKLRARVTGAVPLLTPDAVDVFRHSWAFSSDRAVAELGYPMTNLEDGITRTAEFLRAEGR